jgi:vitamin B12 transporter
LTARYNISKSRYVTGGFDNVFNPLYELLDTYNTPGRGAYLTLGWLPQ